MANAPLVSAPQCSKSQSSTVDASRFPIVAAREDGQTSVVTIGDVPFGAGSVPVIAGPCAVESQALIAEGAGLVASLGAAVLRGGAFKPRTSPYSFQGLGMEGLQMMRRAADDAGLPIVTEVLSPELVEAMEPLVDAFQIGARNMHNFPLLEAVGQSEKPVLLKRHFGATITEWILAAEYIADQGNDAIILCERGIRSFGDETRFTFDLAGALWAKSQVRLPVVVDPSHAIGVPELLGAAAAGAVAAGVDGVMVEVHPDRENARCDGAQALNGEQFEALMARVAGAARAVERTIYAG